VEVVGALDRRAWANARASHASKSVSTLVRAALEFPGVSVSNARLVYRSLQLFEAGKLDYAEAYLVAVAEEAGVDRIASFDRSLDRVDTVTRVEP
jgi:predicted nucleic acid-binding protein